MHLEAREKLPLVLVNALDLHDEHRVGVDRDAREPLQTAARAPACCLA